MPEFTARGDALQKKDGESQQPKRTIRRRLLLIFAVVIIAVFVAGALRIGMFAGAPTAPGANANRPKDTFSVATYNIFYASDPTDVEKVIRAVDADIICLQETIAAHQDHFVKRLADLYAHQTNSLSSIQNGPTVLSKFPLRNYRYIESKVGANGFSVCEANIDGRWVQIANVHLHPVIGVTGLNKFANLKEIHQGEAQQFGTLIHDELPALVMGDFNAFSDGAGQEYMKERGFTDAAAEIFTMPDNHPTIEVKVMKIPVKARIDYIFRSPGLITKSVRVFEGAPSDHDGVIGTFQFAGDESQ